MVNQSVNIETVSTEDLVTRLKLALAQPEDEACDNRSDNLCCDYCGIGQMFDELVSRGVRLADHGL